MRLVVINGEKVGAKPDDVNVLPAGGTFSNELTVQQVPTAEQIIAAFRAIMANLARAQFRLVKK